MKKKWREILDQWRKETRYPGSIPKEQFPHLLDKLWRGIDPNVAENLGFRATGLHPANSEEVLKRIPDGINDAEVERVLDNSLIDLLKEHRGTGTERKRKRGRKVDPGTDAVCEKPSVVSEKSPTTADEPGPSTSAPTRKSKRGGKGNSSQCGICRINWKDYKGAIDWIQCTKCLAWICGSCNKDSKDPFLCATDDDSEDCESQRKLDVYMWVMCWNVTIYQLINLLYPGLFFLSSVRNNLRL
ncbi:hypothetical protein MML48_8g00015426 [Holotrichia oblita]|uniref:Uncharacterized protein n=1 Tax=Holotrichia oblita TaxID=644536 RepID=A0ACB9SPH2_HOLOL|nr:hypothetical protein MML48_8g00015426 [Holotrichia oblita]